MLSRIALVSVFTILLSTSCGFAAEDVTVCAKYRAEYGWSKGYKVDATVLKGTELNSATNSFSYTSYGTYTVIFWDETRATIIEMDSPFLSYIGTEGEDQEGRTWQVAKTSVCY